MEVPSAIYLHHTWQQELEGKVVLSSCQDPCGKQEHKVSGTGRCFGMV